MRVLWHSNAPWAGSGYGNQTNLFTQAIHDDGNEVIISVFFGLNGSKLRLDERMVALPGGYTQFGQDVMGSHFIEQKPDVFVSLIDIWVFDPRELRKFPYVWWCPVDSLPIPPRVAERMQLIKYPWAMSKFGEQQLRNYGIEPFYIPHGIDIDTYKPIDRNEARSILNLPNDAFIFSSVAANKGVPSRKNLPQMLKAFALFVQKHPDAFLLLHTNPMKIHDGVDIDRLIEFYGIPKTNIIVPEVYKLAMGMYDEKYLNYVYNASDAFLLPSAGEGFGIPVVEAQAAGCPVIVSDYTAQSELCGAGIKIPIDFDDTVYTLQDTEQALNLRPSKIVMAMEEAYQKFRSNPQLRTTARTFAESYDYKTVYKDHMKPALEFAAEQNRRNKADSAGKYYALGSDYHWKPEFQSGHYPEWITKQLAFLPEKGDGRTVLDVGCGDGYPASKLAERGYKVVGVDPVESAIEVAKAKVPDAEFFTEYPDDEYDYVVALDSIEHMENPAKLIEACSKVQYFALISTPPPGLDRHAVRGYTMLQLAELFSDFYMDVLYQDDIDQLIKVTPKANTCRTCRKRRKSMAMMSDGMVKGYFCSDKCMKKAREKRLNPLKIAVLSDCRVRTDGITSHGLGNSVFEIANGLANRGHSVTMFAGKGSSFESGKLVEHDDETRRAKELATSGLEGFDVIIDGSHNHDLSVLRPDLNIINRVGDGECPYPPPNAVVSTKFLQSKYGGKIIPTGIKLDDIPERNGTKPKDHLLYFGRISHDKGVRTAQDVARLANKEIKFAGPVQMAIDLNGNYLGELHGEEKWKAIHEAIAVIVPGGMDHGPRVPLEVAAAGVPVLTLDHDGTHEHVANGVSGFIAGDIASLVEKVKDIGQIKSDEARSWVKAFHNYDQMILMYEKALRDVQAGERW